MNIFGIVSVEGVNKHYELDLEISHCKHEL